MALLLSGFECMVHYPAAGTEGYSPSTHALQSQWSLQDPGVSFNNCLTPKPNFTPVTAAINSAPQELRA
eukprot:12911849-Prorocentrum_lima.AAC.1